MTAINVKAAAMALGGAIAGRNRILCPGPGHSRTDRSLSVTFAEDGSFVAHSFAGDDWRECRDHVKAKLGSDDAPRLAANDNKIAAPPVFLDDLRRVEAALRLWGESVPITGTLAERYLDGRRLAHSGDALRFHSGMRMMIALMTDSTTGRPCGVHRTFLDPDGRKVDRKMLGIARGAVVRLSADADVSNGLAIAEGIETALATGFAPIWACLSAGTIRAFPILPGIGALTIFADNDASGTGFATANECGRRWHESGCEVTIAAPDRVGQDFADLIGEAA